MKRVVAVRLFPTVEQAEALTATLAVVNDAANAVSAVAWEHKVFRAYTLQKLVYGDLKAAGLGAQMAVRVVAKVADAYKVGRDVQRTFRSTGAHPFDDRCLSWQIPADGTRGTVSIWTVAGRMKDVGFAAGPAQMELLRAHRRGQSDLVFRDGMWFLYATCDVADVDVEVAVDADDPDAWLGVDLGIHNIAVASTGTRYSGRRVKHYRKDLNRLRAELQEKGTKSARRKLRQVNRREQRFATDVNHRVSKRIVAEAEGTGRGIALEALKGIRDRAPHRSPRRATHPKWGETSLHSWAFGQLRAFNTYKAAAAGVAVVLVDPAYTSQTCACCGHVEKANRKKGRFACRNRSCGAVAPADLNASRVIAQRAPRAWRAAVNPPKPRSHNRGTGDAATPTASRGHDPQAPPVRAG